MRRTRSSIPRLLLSPDALAQAPIVGQKCWLDVVAQYPSSADLALAQNPLDTPTLGDDLAHELCREPAGRRAAARRPRSCRVATSHQIITDLFVRKACGAGGTVDYRVYAGATHLGVLDAAANDVATWFADRVSGAAAASTCSQS